MASTKKQTSGECCPVFRPEKWDKKTHIWNNKHFIKATIPTFFHIPYIPMIGKKVNKLVQQAEKANKLVAPNEDVLLLFADPHPFKSEIFLSVTDDVPNANNVSFTGTYVSKVFDGKNREIPKFIKQFDAYLNGQNKKANNYYVHYAYCPKCAKESGHNYMVFFAEVD